jgi:hypothetical protein
MPPSTPPNNINNINSNNGTISSRQSRPSSAAATTVRHNRPLPSSITSSPSHQQHLHGSHFLLRRGSFLIDLFFDIFLLTSQQHIHTKINKIDDDDASPWSSVAIPSSTMNGRPSSRVSSASGTTTPTATTATRRGFGSNIGTHSNGGSRTSRRTSSFGAPTFRSRYEASPDLAISGRPTGVGNDSARSSRAHSRTSSFTTPMGITSLPGSATHSRSTSIVDYFIPSQSSPSPLLSSSIPSSPSAQLPASSQSINRAVDEHTPIPSASASAMAMLTSPVPPSSILASHTPADSALSTPSSPRSVSSSSPTSPSPPLPSPPPPVATIISPTNDSSSSVRPTVGRISSVVSSPSVSRPMSAHPRPPPTAPTNAISPMLRLRVCYCHIISTDDDNNNDVVFNR